MEFGISFFPNVGQEEKSGHDYWGEASKQLAIYTDLGKPIVSIQRAPRASSYFWKSEG